MARKTAMRTNYMQEAIAMRRFASAVEADTTATVEWKKEVIGHLQAAMTLFLKRDSERLQQ